MSALTIDKSREQFRKSANDLELTLNVIPSHAGSKAIGASVN